MIVLLSWLAGCQGANGSSARSGPPGRKHAKVRGEVGLTFVPPPLGRPGKTGTRRTPGSCLLSARAAGEPVATPSRPNARYTAHPHDMPSRSLLPRLPCQEPAAQACAANTDVGIALALTPTLHRRSQRQPGKAQGAIRPVDRQQLTAVHIAVPGHTRRHYGWMRRLIWMT